MQPWIIVLIIVAVLVLFMIFLMVLTRYKKCPPNKIMVIYGKVGADKAGNSRSAKCIHGGAAFIWPLVQSFTYLDLTPLSISVDLKSALSRQNIRIEEIDLKDLVILSPGNCMRDQIIELCQARRSMPSHYSFESGSLDTLMRIVDCTSCLTIIPEMAVEYIPSDRRDRLKTLSKGATSRKIAVAVRRTYVKNSIIRALTETILANVPGAKA